MTKTQNEILKEVEKYMGGYVPSTANKIKEAIRKGYEKAISLTAKEKDEEWKAKIQKIKNALYQSVYGDKRNKDLIDELFENLLSENNIQVPKKAEVGK